MVKFVEQAALPSMKGELAEYKGFGLEIVNVVVERMLWQDCSIISMNVNNSNVTNSYNYKIRNY